MKTTRAQQAKTHRLIIRAAVDLMTQHGFDGTTMKQIARAAALGDATIYKYFPSKEKLVMAYFEQAIGDAITQMGKTKGQDSFSLQERMQLLIDSFLEILLADREFVGVARRLIERTPTLLLGETLPGKLQLKQAFIQMLEQAEATNEIVECGFKPSLSGLLADYVYAVIAYWLRDDTDGFGNTTQMVDLTLGILVLALRSGMIDKLLELGGFMVRSQLGRLMQDGGGLLDLLRMAKRGVGGMSGERP